MADPGDHRADSDESTSRLVALAQTGDRAAMERLLRTAYPQVLATCTQVLGAREPHDAVQNALISISRRIAQFDGRSKFSTWCYRIATNAAIDELRRIRRHSDRAVDDGAAALEVIQSGAPGPERSTEVRFTVRDALSLLPREQREVFLLRELEGLHYEEIAAETGVPIGTVRSRLARARASLTAILDPRNFEPGGDVSPLGPQER